MNFNQLLTELDPTYRAKVGYLHQEMQVKAQFEQFRAREAMNRESFKAQEDMRRESLKANEAMKREQYKSQQESYRLGQKYNYEKQLEQQSHENRLLQLEESIKGSILKAGFDLMTDLIKKSADEDEKRRVHIQEQLTIRTQMRSEVAKMVIEAAIKEKLAQKQHQRDLELRVIDHKNHQESQVWTIFQGFLVQTYEKQGKTQTEREIDRIINEWQAMA